MHVACLQENLKAALTAVLPATTAKIPPILETVRLAADDGQVTLTATNLETTITARLGAKIETPGACCIPAKVLAELVSGFPNDRVTLSLDGRTLTLRVGHYETTLDKLDADEFPNTPAIQATSDVPLSFLRDLAAFVAPAAATDDTRPVLRGVQVRLNGTAEALAADGFRLAQLEQALDGATIPAVSALIPAKTLIAAAKAFKSVDDGLIRIGTTQAADGPFAAAGACVIDAGDIQIVTRIIDGAFPNVATVIPDAYTTRVVVETQDLRQGVAIASVYAKRSAEVIKIQVAGPANDMGVGRLTLSANAAHVGSSTVLLDAMVAGADVTIALNAPFLAAALACITTPQVAIELQTPQAPAVFKPVGRDGYLQLIMPMSVK